MPPTGIHKPNRPWCQLARPVSAAAYEFKRASIDAVIKLLPAPLAISASTRQADALGRKAGQWMLQPEQARASRPDTA